MSMHRQPMHGALCAVVAFLAIVGVMMSTPNLVHAVDLATLVGGTKRTLPSDATMPTISFPIELTAEADGASVSVDVIEVLRGDIVLSESVVDAAVDVERLALDIEVKDGSAFSPAGDYSITVLLSDGGENRQSITVTLARPAAKLSASGVVEVVDYVGLLSWWNDDGRPPLELSVERGAAIQSVTARQVEPSTGKVKMTAACTGHDGESATCDLTSGTPVDLAAPVGGDGVLDLGYDPSEFPLGTTVRTVELSSPQLAAPVTVSFQVTKRRSPFLIPLIVVVGLLAGVLVRNVLTRLIAWSRREKAKSELLELIAGFRRRYADPDFRSKLATIEARLDAKGLTLEQISTQRDAVSDELTAVNHRLVAVTTAADAVAVSVAGSWTVPAAVHPSIVAVGDAVSAVRDSLDARDAKTATEQLALATDGQGKAREDALDWIGRYRGAVKAAKSSIAGLNESSWFVVNLRRTLDEAEQFATVAEDAELREILVACQSLTRDWQRDVEPAVRSAIAERSERAPALARQALDALGKPDPADRLGEVASPLGQLLTMPPLPPPAPAPAGQAPGTPSNESARTALDGAGAPEPAGEDAAVLLGAYDIGALGHLRLLPRRLAASVIGGVAKSVLYVILAGIIAFVAYAAGSDDWVGGSSQIVALFGWAFALDVTVGAVTAMFGQAGAMPPTFADAGDDADA